MQHISTRQYYSFRTVKISNLVVPKHIQYSYSQLCALQESGFKDGLVAAVNKLLDPVRAHFKNDAKAKAILDQVGSVCSFSIKIFDNSFCKLYNSCYDPFPYHKLGIPVRSCFLP